MLHALRLGDVITCLNAALGVNHHALYEQLHRLFPHEGLRVNSLENDSLRLSSVYPPTPTALTASAQKVLLGN